MNRPLTRLARLGALSLLAPALLGAGPGSRPLAEASARLAALERQVGGRLGVAVLDTGSGRRLEPRAGERFPMCSTFKTLLAAHVLALAERGGARLDQRLPFGPADLEAHAPVARARVAEGALSVEDLCAATMVESDNTAANLLLRAFGGPEAVTAFARRLGDPLTRLDRREPELNEARPGDPRDTTTPRAMLGALRVLLLDAAPGSPLSAAARTRLEGWMAASTTGRRKLRAGLPAAWAAGDKSGAGERGTVNDVALLRPPGRAPLLVAVYLTGSRAAWADREAALAEVGRIVAGAFQD